MEENSVNMKLEKIFRNVFDNETIQIKREMTANDLDEWNSLNHMLLVSEIENVFSIKFRLKELNQMKNVGDMIDMIISKL